MYVLSAWYVMILIKQKTNHHKYWQPCFTIDPHLVERKGRLQPATRIDPKGRKGEKNGGIDSLFLFLPVPGIEYERERERKRYKTNPAGWAGEPGPSDDSLLSAHSAFTSGEDPSLFFFCSKAYTHPFLCMCGLPHPLTHVLDGGGSDLPPASTFRAQSVLEIQRLYARPILYQPVSKMRYYSIGLCLAWWIAVPPVDTINNKDSKCCALLKNNFLSSARCDRSSETNMTEPTEKAKERRRMLQVPKTTIVSNAIRYNNLVRKIWEGEFSGNSSWSTFFFICYFFLHSNC